MKYAKQKTAREKSNSTLNGTVKNSKNACDLNKNISSDIEMSSEAKFSTYKPRCTITLPSPPTNIVETLLNLYKLIKYTLSQPMKSCLLILYPHHYPIQAIVPIEGYLKILKYLNQLKHRMFHMRNQIYECLSSPTYGIYVKNKNKIYSLDILLS